MKLGIVGLPQSGKSTLFVALTGARGEGEFVKLSRSEEHIATVKVMDERVDFLTALYKPKKTTYAQLEYLLPRLKRMWGHLSRQQGGTGIGLTVARHMAKLMGGNITLESAVGQGSRFTVTFPLV